MLLEWHILYWWGVRLTHEQSCLFSVCSSAATFKLLWHLSLVTDVVTTAFSQLKATSSNSFHAHIAFLFQFLHKHEKINKTQKTHDWHIARIQSELVEVALLFNYSMLYAVWYFSLMVSNTINMRVQFLLLTVSSLCLIILHHWVSNC